MTTSQMHEFARVGAEARLKAIAEEQQTIFDAFPELRDGAAPAKRASSPAAAPGRKRRQMSAAERKAVGERMKAYWAKRRAKKAGKATSEAPKGRRRRGGMSAEARKAQAERMRAYWAERRAQKQGSAEGAPAEAANAGGETPSSAKSGRKAGPKSGRKAGRKQGRKK